MSSIPSFRLPGPLENVVDDVTHDVKSEADKAAATVRDAATTLGNTVPKTANDVRAAITAARPDAAFANLTSDVVAKLPPSMRGFLSRMPNMGTIGDDVAMGKPAVISSPEFGESSATPSILEVPISAKQEGLLAVGKKVHDKFFPDSPPFNFNVNFSCAKTDPLTGHSEYADPKSPWFNVFFGRYQIDCPAGKPGDDDKWQRPFGFVRPGSNEINFDDILKIGNSDWGYFSNWMYGVPEGELDKAFAAQAAGKKPTCTVTNDSVLINGKEYVECEIDGLKLPSAYVSGKDGKSLQKNDLLSPVWQQVFGKQSSSVSDDPSVAAAYPDSFVPTEMKMKFYLHQEKRWDPEAKGYVYSTQIYGGGVNKTWAGADPAKQAFNERFLKAQMDAVKETMPRPSWEKDPR